VSCSPMEQILERLRAFGEFEVWFRNGLFLADYLLSHFVTSN
jgi:hypothetical protein